MFIFTLIFWFSTMTLSDALVLPVSQRPTQVMTSLIGSHIEYFIHTYNIIVLIL